LAVLFVPNEISEDSQEWLSYKIHLK
jgi:hypothetical protein